LPYPVAHSAPSEDLKLASIPPELQHAKVPLLPSTQKGKKKEKQQQLQFSSLSLSLSDKKETQNIDTAHCGKQASKQATPEAPHSWFLTFKIVKNLGEELDETDRQRTMSEERQWGRLWFIRAYLISYNLNELKLIDMPSSSAIRW
jgi:hypothetical protein